MTADVVGEKPVSGECRLGMVGAWLWLAVLVTGCGTTQSQMATQQLLMSDAVDRAVAKIDFEPLAGKKVFFDDRYMLNIKGLGFVNSEYIVSALRQQMFAAGCRLQQDSQTADVIVEARVGGLGTDGHEVTYGIPPSKTLSSAASAIPNVPDVPMFPEISFAKRNDQMGAAKVAVFAYERETRDPLWQSGTSIARSDAKDVWIFGAGPFQNGTIYKGPRFAGQKLRFPLAAKVEEEQPEAMTEEGIAFDQPFEFSPLAAPSPPKLEQPWPGQPQNRDVQPVQHQEPLANKAKENNTSGKSGS
jgi:hypothetical protein